MIRKILIASMLVASFAPAHAVIDGVHGTTFDFTAKQDFIVTPDGGSITIWGYANGTDPGTRAQYPGPTLIVNEGDTVTIRLHNELSVPVSIVFPGQSKVSATGGAAGALTREIASGDPGFVTYSFVASNPGTYLYHSGTRPDLQTEMGLLGAIVVRPSMGANYAYNDAGTRFDQEYLFLLTDMDPSFHDLVEFDDMASIDTSKFFPVYWFINGRAAPDTLGESYSPFLPTQPYNALPRMHPGEKLLMRVIGAGRDLHPFHHHGNHALIIARDGRLLSSSPGAGPDLGYPVFTVQSVPGETIDAIFEWTGKALGWDIYGHHCGNPTCTAVGDPPLEPNEYAGDHGKAFPVIMPELQNLTIGPHWNGSPYLGQFGSLPPGSGNLNLHAGYYHMWHSHNEKEIVNFDLFPGGMMTMLVIEPPGVPIP
jgi:FtsP/CotA-like multicopper oxidase with cupredoxin domain